MGQPASLGLNRTWARPRSFAPSTRSRCPTSGKWSPSRSRSKARPRKRAGSRREDVSWENHARSSTRGVRCRATRPWSGSRDIGVISHELARLPCRTLSVGVEHVITHSRAR
eukprot:172950-Rhodomonas_salina.1